MFNLGGPPLVSVVKSFEEMRVVSLVVVLIDVISCGIADLEVSEGFSELITSLLVGASVVK